MPSSLYHPKFPSSRSFVFFLLLFSTLIASMSPHKSSQVKMMILSGSKMGSRRPACVNKCLSCWPCKAILVIPHIKNTDQQQDSYYLLAWKCRCRDRLYQP